MSCPPHEFAGFRTEPGVPLRCLRCGRTRAEIHAEQAGLSLRLAAESRSTRKYDELKARLRTTENWRMEETMLLMPQAADAIEALEAKVKRNKPDEMVWVETDGFAGRMATPAILISENNGARTVTVRLLASLRVGGKTYPAGTNKRVPRRSVVNWPSAIAHVKRQEKELPQ